MHAEAAVGHGLDAVAIRVGEFQAAHVGDQAGQFAVDVRQERVDGGVGDGDLAGGDAGAADARREGVQAADRVEAGSGGPLGAGSSVMTSMPSGRSPGPGAAVT